MEKEKVCFVITGFGKKTDFQTGTVYDLQKTYDLLLKPVFEELGYRCFRTTELKYSGSIDVEMYYYILNADFVIADISTLNANAMYELGVRHALCPDTTIVIGESSLMGDKDKNISPRIPFDLGHGVIFTYKHDGDSINADEVKRFTTLLRDLVVELMDKDKNDSPVYTYLPGLEPPVFKEIIRKKTEETEQGGIPAEEGESLSDLLKKAEEAKKKGDIPTALELFKQAMKQSANDTFVTQRFAMLTYKSELPTKKEALLNALDILKPLKPDTTNDVETLGLMGAIYKRLYEENKDVEDLKMSLNYYRRGFYVSNDYYNGVNTAFDMKWLGFLSTDSDAKIAYNKMAQWTWESVLANCVAIIGSPDGNKRDDFMWVLQTKAECELGLGKTQDNQMTEMMMNMLGIPQFNLTSYQTQITKLKAIMGS